MADWTLDELVQLRRLYGSRSNKWLARKFGCSEDALEAKAAELALGKNKRTFVGGAMPRWSKEQIADLRRLYPKTSNAEIGVLIGKSVKAVTSKASRLNLSKAPVRMREMGRENVALRRERIEKR